MLALPVLGNGTAAARRKPLDQICGSMRGVDRDGDKAADRWLQLFQTGRDREDRADRTVRGIRVIADDGQPGAVILTRRKQHPVCNAAISVDQSVDQPLPFKMDDCLVATHAGRPAASEDDKAGRRVGDHWQGSG
nr:hypothetical protein [Sphingopyxis sp. BSNA05]